MDNFDELSDEQQEQIEQSNKALRKSYDIVMFGFVVFFILACLACLVGRV